MTIKLGSTVRCLITGLQGIAATETLMLNGNVRYAVQPKSEDGTKYPEAWEIDRQSLTVVDPGVSALCIKPSKLDEDINVGDRVRDKASEFVGVATAQTIHLNGCVYFSVVPKMRDNAVLHDVPSPSYLPVERLERVDSGINENPVEQTGTGGPATRAQRG